MHWTNKAIFFSDEEHNIIETYSVQLHEWQIWFVYVYMTICCYIFRKTVFCFFHDIINISWDRVGITLHSFLNGIYKHIASVTLIEGRGFDFFELI